MIYFISDLHLQEDAPDSARLFFQFLDKLPAQTEALYVLGDLFEVWIGDDDNDPFVQSVIRALRNVSDRGIRVNFMRGNRDFLYGDAFAGQTQGLVLEDETIIDWQGEPCLLLHGDQLCTDDLAYQQFRQMVRSSKWRGDFLLKPLAERRAIAQEMRRRSREAQQGKAEYIMDINEAALADMVRKHRVSRVIHGHTHRPAVHQHSIDGTSVQRIVLGDWHNSAQIFCGESRRGNTTSLHTDPIAILTQLQLA